MFDDVTRQRFWSFVDKRSEGECWRWRGTKNAKGYGRFTYKRGATIMAHRYAIQASIGPIGDLLACHRCDERDCCNPMHLFAGTNAENMADARAKGSRLGPKRKSSTHCPHGHNLEEVGTYKNRNGWRCAECRRVSALEYHHTHAKR